jgi:hypothetical protein
MRLGGQFAQRGLCMLHGIALGPEGGIAQARSACFGLRARGHAPRHRAATAVARITALTAWAAGTCRCADSALRMPGLVATHRHHRSHGRGSNRLGTLLIYF